MKLLSDVRIVNYNDVEKIKVLATIAINIKLFASVKVTQKIARR